jgi:hypothetical protein
MQKIPSIWTLSQLTFLRQDRQFQVGIFPHHYPQLRFAVMVKLPVKLAFFFDSAITKGWPLQSSI